MMKVPAPRSLEPTDTELEHRCRVLVRASLKSVRDEREVKLDCRRIGQLSGAERIARTH